MSAPDFGARYRDVSLLGRGSSGVVHRAFDELRGRYVAVKTLHGLDASMAYDLKRGFRLLSELSHSSLVTVHELVLLDYAPPLARFRVRGSKGLYVRSIARDLGGHVTALRRLASGPFRVEDAGPEPLPTDTAVMHLPEVRLSTEETGRFESGRKIEREVRGPVRVYCGPRFIGVGRPKDGGLQPWKVF